MNVWMDDYTAQCFCTSDRQVSEEEPARDERLFGVAWRFVHDVQVWRVEAQGGGRKSISHQVDPQQLHWNQSFRETQDGCEEDAAHRTVWRHVSIMCGDMMSTCHLWDKGRNDGHQEDRWRHKTAGQ